jgi:predicted anti-sigma-YlaC factor YlaD
MNCEQYQEMISQFVDGELESIHESQLFQHLGTCDICRVFFRNLLSLKQEFVSTRSVQVPVSLDQRMAEMNLPAAAIRRIHPWYLTGRMYSFRAIGLAVFFSVVMTVFVSSIWYQHAQPQQTIVCLTPLPEVEVTGYEIIGSTPMKGNQQ